LGIFIVSKKYYFLSSLLSGRGPLSSLAGAFSSLGGLGKSAFLDTFSFLVFGSLLNYKIHETFAFS
jgi:hypothetical protein